METNNFYWIMSQVEHLAMVGLLALTVIVILKYYTSASSKPKIYTEADLVSFGNYLLSVERFNSTSCVNRGNVTHADLANWKEKQNIRAEVATIIEPKAE